MSFYNPLFVHASGPENAPTIVFLHGGGAAGWMWRPVIAQLPDYHCLAIDLPEQGQSRSGGHFTMESAAEQIAQVIQEQAHGGCASVAGLSEGAQVTVQLLASNPQRVERALISSALLRPMPGSQWMTPGLVAWSFRLSVPPFRNSDWWIRLNMKYAAGIPDLYYPEFKKEFQEMQESGFVNLILANQRFRLPAGLEKYNGPALVVVGAKEYKVMKQSARDLAAALPDARAVQIDLGKGSSTAAEHNWALSAPNSFARTVRAWMEGTALPPELLAL